MGKFSTFAAGLLALSWASAMAAPATEPVTEEPAGTVKWFSEKCVAFSVGSWGYREYFEVDGLAKKMVFADDGKTIWMRNPVSKFPTGTWVEATLEGETITLPMGQVIRHSEAKDGSIDVWTIAAMKMKRVWDEVWESWTIDVQPADLDALTFTYKDGYITENQDSTLVALMCNGKYMVYGDADIEMSSIDPAKDIVRMPENAETQSWTFSHGLSTRIGYPVEVATVDDEVYISGFWQDNPSATIKGTVKDGKLSLPSRQYIGYINSGGVDYFAYFMPCVLGTPGFMQYYQPVAEPMVFDIDDATGMMTQPAETPSAAMKLMIKGGLFDNFELNKSIAFLVLDNPAFKAAAGDYGMPQAPFIGDDCFRYFSDADIPFVQLAFTIQPFDEEGNGLPASDLTYKIWVDDEPVLFDAAEFPNWEKLKTPAYELPLDFSNNWGIAYDDNVYQRRVQVPYPDPEKVGAQVIFTDEKSGEVKKSQIAYYYPLTKEVKYEDDPTGSAVEAVAGEDVAGIEYFNLLGSKVGADFRGVCVKVITYADGSVKSVKTVR